LKRFRVTVNGKIYEVLVEEVGGTVAAPVAAPAPVLAAPPVATPPPARPADPPRTPSPARPAAREAPAPPDMEAVRAPLPGLVVEIKVKPGDPVRAGQVVAVLEAMKMENEIVAPRDGTVAEVRTTKGVNVNLGDILVLIK